MTDPTGDNRRDLLIQKAMKASDEALYFAIGEDVSRGSLDLSQVTRDDIIQYAQSWRDRQAGELRRILCNDAVQAELAKAKLCDLRQAIIIASDLLLAHFGLVPAVCLAVLILRAGIERLCSDVASGDSGVARGVFNER